MLDEILTAGLTPTVTTDYERWKPLHWIIAVPDVMEKGGFDAIIGNPPFLGGSKLTGAMGTNIRDWFVNARRRRAKRQRGPGRLLLPPRLLAADRPRQPWPDRNQHHRAGRHPGSGARSDRHSWTHYYACHPISSWPAASANLEYAAVWGTTRLGLGVHSSAYPTMSR